MDIVRYVVVFSIVEAILLIVLVWWLTKNLVRRGLLGRAGHASTGEGAAHASRASAPLAANPELRAALSHAMKTPLTSMKLLFEGLAENPTEAQLRRYGGMFAEAIAAMERIVDRVLLLTAGGPTGASAISAVDLAERVRGALADRDGVTVTCGSPVDETSPKVPAIEPDALSDTLAALIAWRQEHCHGQILVAMSADEACLIIEIQQSPAADGAAADASDALDPDAGRDGDEVLTRMLFQRAVALMGGAFAEDDRGQADGFRCRLVFPNGPV